MQWPSQRIVNSSTKSFGMYEKARLLAERGTDLIHLEFGRPSHDTPDHIKETAITALRQGHVHYSDVQGLLEFRRAVSEKLLAFNGIPVGPDGIIITNGLTHASYLAFMAGLSDGDEVILLEPYYPQHINKIELAGARPVFAPLDRDSGFAIREDWLESRVSARTRMIVIVNPANPTGRVYTEEELLAVARVAIRHDLIVVSDEVYEQIVYDKRRNLSIASLPGMHGRTISLFAFTKAYAMDGWRLGYLAADPSLIPAMLKISMNDVTHVNTFIQYGGLAALKEGSACVEEMVDEDRRKRDLVVQRLNQMPGVSCPIPEGTIYAFPKVDYRNLSSGEIAQALLEESSVVVEDGAFYGPAGEGHLRVCFGSEPYERLALAMDRMSAFFNDRETR